MLCIHGCASQGFSKSQQCNGLWREIVLAQNNPSQDRTFSSPYSVEKLREAYIQLECDKMPRW